jgi:tRNA(Phe) wybutosine-synthesizing methylase Tyw3
MIKILPVDLRALETLKAEMLQKIQPLFIFPYLTNETHAEDMGLIELRVHAGLDKRDQIIVPNGKVDVSYIIDVDTSSDIVDALENDDRVLITRMAFSQRQEQIERKMRKGKPGMLDLQQRLFTLEGRCRRIIDTILADDMENLPDWDTYTLDK